MDRVRRDTIALRPAGVALLASGVAINALTATDEAGWACAVVGLFMLSVAATVRHALIAGLTIMVVTLLGVHDRRESAHEEVPGHRHQG